MALAAVLGLGVEDIQIREAAGPEPPVKANTAPSQRPTSNPSPNTEVAVQPSNAAQGFPSGDN